MRIPSLSALLTTTTICFTAFTHNAEARDQVRAVGSSTVYPFITIAAESFGQQPDTKTPIVESTGTGGGFKLFCSGLGDDYPDIINASRAIKESETAECEKNGVKEITEIKLGYDGIIVANAIGDPVFHLTRDHLFKALAKEVEQDGKLVPNPYNNWKEIDPSLPDAEIIVYGPPPTSGTRDAFVELIMEEACHKFPAFKAKYANAEKHARMCKMLREDGKFVEAGENDNLIVQKLTKNPESLGIFGYSFLEENTSLVQGSSIEGVEPSFDTIADGSYPIARPLYVYVKDAQFATVPTLKGFIAELLSERSMGEEGYLADAGLIPLPEEESEAQHKAIDPKLGLE